MSSYRRDPHRWITIIAIIHLAGLVLVLTIRDMARVVIDIYRELAR